MRLILQLCVLLTVLLGVENHAWGKVAAPENIAVRGLRRARSLVTWQTRLQP